MELREVINQIEIITANSQENAKGNHAEKVEEEDKCQGNRKPIAPYAEQRFLETWIQIAT